MCFFVRLRRPPGAIRYETLLPYPPLFRSEAEVATGLAEGLSIEEIATARGVALETIRAQIRAIYGKTDVRTRAELVRMLLEMPSFDQAGKHAGTSSEEHTSELQSLMRTSYAVFCLKKKNTTKHISHH